MASVRVDSPGAEKGLKYVITVFLNSVRVPTCFKTVFHVMNVSYYTIMMNTQVIFVATVLPWYPLLVKTDERFWKALPILWYSFGNAVEGKKRNVRTDTHCVNGFVSS